MEELYNMQFQLSRANSRRKGQPQKHQGRTNRNLIKTNKPTFNANYLIPFPLKAPPQHHC